MNEIKLKKLDVLATIKVPENVDISELPKVLNHFCQTKEWQYLGSKVEVLEELVISGETEKNFYQGSPLKLEYVKAGCDITPYRELAMAFSHKPSRVSINNGVISHNGIIDSYLYIIDEEINIKKDLVQHPNSSFPQGYEMLIKRDLKLKLIKELKSTNS